jgi:decaprenylphospho-beta-D-ribofuranose 2-oxidase
MSASSISNTLTAPERELVGWGMRNRASGHLLRPTNPNDLATALAEADERGVRVCLRGGGNSYGDAAILQSGLILDCSAANRILDWAPETGIVTVEPGVTIADLWRRVLPDGWRPPVVPGRGVVTIAGAAAANVHGKNNWRIGCFGDHIVSFDLALPNGDIKACSRTTHPDLFFAAIGGMGLIGVFTSFTLQLTRVWSGLVAERQTASAPLAALMEAMEAAAPSASDMVAWIDASASGAALGRGLLAVSHELSQGEDPRASETLRSAWANWPSGAVRLLDLLPTDLLPMLARPLSSHAGATLANRAQWLRGSIGGHDWRRIPYPSANFPLDMIPNWQYSYLPGGLIQSQAFLPLESAREGFAALLRRTQEAGFPPSFAIMKKHRASDFALNYLLDGYSLAMDFPIHLREEARMLALARELNELIIAHGGRLYFAKDNSLTADQTRRMLPAATLAAFAARKSTYDPNETLQTELYRRALRPNLIISGGKGR